MVGRWDLELPVCYKEGWFHLWLCLITLDFLRLRPEYPQRSQGNQKSQNCLLTLLFKFSFDVISAKGCLLQGKMNKFTQCKDPHKLDIFLLLLNRSSSSVLLLCPRWLPKTLVTILIGGLNKSVRHLLLLHYTLRIPLYWHNLSSIRKVTVSHLVMWSMQDSHPEVSVLAFISVIIFSFF